MRLVRLVSGVALAALCATSLTSPAAAEPEAAGFSCGFTSTDDPTGTLANPGTQIGEIDGGPFVAADVGDATDVPVEIYLFCSIQVGGTGSYYDPDAVNVSVEGDVVAYLPPTLISYAAGSLDPVWTCTEVWVASRFGHTTFFLDSVSQDYVTDESSATCALAVSHDTPSPSRRTPRSSSLHLQMTVAD